MQDEEPHTAHESPFTPFGDSAPTPSAASPGSMFGEPPPLLSVSAPPPGYVAYSPETRVRFSKAARATLIAGAVIAALAAVRALAFVNRLSVVHDYEIRQATIGDVRGADDWVTLLSILSPVAFICWLVASSRWRRRTKSMLGIMQTGLAGSQAFKQAVRRRPEAWRAYQLWQTSGLVFAALVVAALVVLPRDVSGREALRTHDRFLVGYSVLYAAVFGMHTVLGWRSKKAIEATFA